MARHSPPLSPSALQPMSARYGCHYFCLCDCVAMQPHCEVQLALLVLLLFHMGLASCCVVAAAEQALKSSGGV